MANVYNAIHANAYLSVEGSDRPKAEVGSSAEGAYSFQASVTNLSDVAKRYTLDTAVLVEQVTGLEGTELTFAANGQKRLGADEAQVTYAGFGGRRALRPRQLHRGIYRSDFSAGQWQGLCGEEF